MIIKPIIAPACRENLAECCLLLKQPGLEIPSGGYFKKKWLEAYLDNDFFLVAKRGKVLVGVLVAEKVKLDGCILWWLAVSKKEQGKGIGSILLKKLESNCKKIGLKWIILYAPIGNPKSVSFYKKKGFSIGEKLFELKKDLK